MVETTKDAAWREMILQAGFHSPKAWIVAVGHGAMRAAIWVMK